MFVVHLRDGRTMKEEDGVEWKDIVQEDITSLQLQTKDGRIHTVSADGKNIKFLQLKRNLLDMVKGTDKVVERVIGYIVDDKYAVKLEVYEESGDSKLTLEVKEGKKWRKL